MIVLLVIVSILLAHVTGYLWGLMDGQREVLSKIHEIASELEGVTHDKH